MNAQLVAGRNPASRMWPNHNPAILYIERPSNKGPAEIVPPLMLAQVLEKAEK